MSYILNFIRSIGRLAIKMIVDNQSDAYVITNDQGIVIRYNKSFRLFFMDTGIKYRKKNIKLKDILLSGRLSKSEADDLTCNILKSAVTGHKKNFEQYFNSINKHFLIEINRITVQSTYMGDIIMFRDISEYKKLMEKMKCQNEELIILNHELTDYLQTVEELTLERERNRIETEIHNLMSHNLNVLLRLMEVCRVSVKNDREKAYSALLDAESIIRDTARNVSEIAGTLKVEGGSTSKCSKINKLDYIKEMIDSYEKNTSIRVDYFFDRDFSNVDNLILKVVYNIFQEAMTNSMKHGNAKIITILLKCQQGSVFLSIMDDGTGCNSITKSGMGLKGMENMVSSLKGRIEFKSVDEGGFKIYVVIPVTQGGI